MFKYLGNVIKKVLNPEPCCDTLCVSANDDVAAVEDIPSGPGVVLGKTYYTHLRRYILADDNYWELSNHGGATLAFRVFKDDDDYTIEFTWAECNLEEKDQFCKKTGRDICDNRLADKDPMNVLPHVERSETHPSVQEVRKFVIDEYLLYKRQFQPSVMWEYE